MRRHRVPHSRGEGRPNTAELASVDMAHAGECLTPQTALFVIVVVPESRQTMMRDSTSRLICPVSAQAWFSERYRNLCWSDTNPLVHAERNLGGDNGRNGIGSNGRESVLCKLSPENI